MADTTALKNRIRAAIKANDNQEITGPVLQQTLLDIVDELDLYPELQEAINTEKNARQVADTQLNDLITGIKNNIDNGYVYAGIATPSTVPVSGKVFYVTVQAGTYTNFLDSGSDALVVTQGINILKFNGTAWSVEQVIAIDGMPKANSDGIVKSGAVSYVLANINIPNTENYNDHAYYTNQGIPAVDQRYRLTKIDISACSILYVRSRSNIGESACCVTSEDDTVLAYFNFDGTKIETIDLTLYTGAKYFLYSNFVPYLPESDMLLQAYLKKSIYEAMEAERQQRINADTILANVINTKLAEGYIYAGIATPSTNPSTPVGKVFYVATVAGTYTNFLNSSSQPLVLTQGINILKFNGTAWSVEQVIAIDGMPKANSDGIVKSGAASYVLANINISNTENYNDHAYYDNSGVLNVGDSRYRSTKIDVSECSLLYVKSSSNTHNSACCVTSEDDTVLAYFNFDGTKIETIDLTQYFGAKYFLYSNFVPYLPESNMLIQAYLKKSIYEAMESLDKKIRDTDVIPTILSKKAAQSDGIIRFVQESIGEFSFYENSELPYYNSDGSIANNTNRLKTFAIPVQAGDKFTYSISNYSNVYAIAALDSSGNLLTEYSIKASFDWKDAEYIVPSGVSSLIFCTLSGYSNKVIKNNSVGGSLINIGKDIIFMNQFNDSSIENGKTLYFNTGVITNGNSSYHLLKVNIDSDGYYLIKVPSQPDHETLWKFTDSTYATPEKRIIGRVAQQIYDIVYLEEGYYALSWNKGSESVAYGEVTFAKANEFIKYVEASVKNYGVGIHDFSYLSATGWTIAADKKSAINSANGITNRITYGYRSYEDNVIVSVTANPTFGDANGYYEILVGKYEEIGGTFVAYGKDLGGDYIAVYRVNDAGNGVVNTHKFYFTGLFTGIGNPVSLYMEKETTNSFVFAIKVVDAKGNVFEKDNIGDGSTLTGDEVINTNDAINGNCWGKFAIFASVGIFNVTAPNMVYPKDMQNLKLLICGHSMVESSTMIHTESGIVHYDIDKCLSVMLRNNIGEKNVIISGKGGENMGGDGFQQYMRNTFTLAKSAKYVLIWLGGNDPGNETSQINAANIDNVARQYGLIPVWLTVTPQQANPTKYIAFNEWMLANLDNVVDVTPACYTTASYESVDIPNTENYNDHAYYNNAGVPNVDTRYRLTKIDVSQFLALKVRACCNTNDSACVLTDANGTVLAYFNYDGSQIEDIDLTQYSGAKWFLYSNFVPYLAEEYMMIQTQGQQVLDNSVYMDTVHLNEKGYRRCYEILKAKATYLFGI